MKKKFLKVAEDSHFFDKHDKVLVAVSGGLDSMNLLQLLHDTQDDLQIELGVAHVDHGQRPESVTEEEYLRQLASEWGMPFFCARFSGKFSETRARQFRYDFFKKIMIEQGYTALVTAHHANDQAETIFMRWLRGSRLLHLSGIPAVQSFGPGQLIRPLLSFQKSDLPDIFHFEDASNQQADYLRNRIRNHYLPALTAENPHFQQHLLEFGQEIQNYVLALRELTAEMDATHLPTFTAQPEAVQIILLQFYLEQFPDLQLNKAQFADLLHILRTKKTYQHYLKNGYYLVKDEQKFTLSKVIPETDDRSQPVVLECDSIYSDRHRTISYNIPLDSVDFCLTLPSDSPILIRKRQPGDRILVNGLYKKIRRYFIDQKIPKNLRNQPIVLEQDGKIVGLANIVASDLSKRAKSDIMKPKLYIKMKE